MATDQVKDSTLTPRKLDFRSARPQPDLAGLPGASFALTCFGLVARPLPRYRVRPRGCGANAATARGARDGFLNMRRGRRDLRPPGRGLGSTSNDRTIGDAHGVRTRQPGDRRERRHPQHESSGGAERAVGRDAQGHVRCARCACRVKPSGPLSDDHRQWTRVLGQGQSAKPRNGPLPRRAGHEQPRRSTTPSCGACASFLIRS